MAAYPRRVDQELVWLREGLALHWVPPREVLERVLAQIDGQLAPALDQSPFFDPFTRLGKDIPAAEQDALKARGRQAVDEQVLPALRRLRAFVADEYLAGGAAERRARHLPGRGRGLCPRGAFQHHHRAEPGADPRHRPA